MLKLKGVKDEIPAVEITSILSESYPDDAQEIEFETFLKVKLLTCNFDVRSSN